MNAYDDLVQEFIGQMRADGYSRHALESYGYGARMFLTYLVRERILTLNEVSKGVVKNYRSYLYYYRSSLGKRVSIKTQADRLIALRLFFKIMKRRNRILYDYGRNIEIPRVGRRLPRNLMSEQEVVSVLTGIQTGSLLGYRDRVMLEVLYGTGMRQSEVLNLELGDLDLERKDLTVRNGKGGQDRVIPLHENLSKTLREYVGQVRPRLAVAEAKPHVFLGISGKKIGDTGMQAIVQRHVKASGINKRVSPHVFRHSIATHLLERGLDIRYVQEFLGHRSLRSTQIYTRVTIRDLRKMYKRYHPKEMRRSDAGEEKQENPEKELTAEPGKEYGVPGN